MPAFTIPDTAHSSLKSSFREANDCHEPAGSPNGGQFCSKGGGKSDGPLWDSQWDGGPRTGYGDPMTSFKTAAEAKQWAQGLVDRGRGAMKVVALSNGQYSAVDSDVPIRTPSGESLKVVSYVNPRPLDTPRTGPDTSWIDGALPGSDTLGAALKGWGSLGRPWGRDRTGRVVTGPEGAEPGGQYDLGYVVPDRGAQAGRSKFWQLDDYKVDSVSGGSIWLRKSQMFPGAKRDDTNLAWNARIKSRRAK